MAVVFFAILFSPFMSPSLSSYPVAVVFSAIPESLRGLSVLFGITAWGVCGYNGLSLAVSGRFWPLH